MSPVSGSSKKLWTFFSSSTFGMAPNPAFSRLKLPSAAGAVASLLAFRMASASFTVSDTTPPSHVMMEGFLFCVGLCPSRAIRRQSFKASTSGSDPEALSPTATAHSNLTWLEMSRQTEGRLSSRNCTQVVRHMALALRVAAVNARLAILLCCRRSACFSRNSATLTNAAWRASSAFRICCVKLRSSASRSRICASSTLTSAALCKPPKRPCAAADMELKIRETLMPARSGSTLDLCTQRREPKAVLIRSCSPIWRISPWIPPAGKAWPKRSACLTRTVWPTARPPPPKTPPLARSLRLAA
mmetsp:Transcript_129999/g.308428  ORF Transcript_129999/g.308428 Transcript_129999/m.308428 type:complete len:301 (-) Transcript_129999:317-1219(-)